MNRRTRQRSGDTSITEYRQRYDGPVEFRHAAPRKGKRKQRAPLWTKLCIIFGVLCILVSVTGAAFDFFLTQRYENNINRKGLVDRGADWNPPSLDGPINFLILGTDKRSADDYDPNDPSSNEYNTPTARADTIMWLHIPKGAEKGYVISIPRDSYVHIPTNADISDAKTEWRGGKTKINAAFAYGGSEAGGSVLMTRTLKKLTGVSVDYPVLVNFQAVRNLTEALDGVDVVVEEKTQDYRTLEIFEAGKQRLNGERADAYVRQRKQICPNRVPVTNPQKKGPECHLERGDYDRQARQQQFIRAVSQRVKELEISEAPSKIDKVLQAVIENLTVDKQMPVKDTVFGLKHLGTEDMTFLTLPIAESATLSNGQIVEKVNMTQTEELFTALQNGTLEQYVQEYGANDVSSGR